MRIAPRYFAFLAFSFLFAANCVAQAPQPQPTATPKSASVSGRVTLSGKPAAGITVVATTTGSFLENRTAAKTTTDEEGNYRLSGLPAGTLRIVPIAKSLAPDPDSKSKALGQSVNVAEGDSITKVDLALVRGAVVTGKITDAQGNPIIGERVNVTRQGEPGESPQMGLIGGSRNRTDDRGIYRIYGLSPGEYTVSVGEGPGAPSISVMGRGTSQYPKTYFPSVKDKAKATVLELSEGEEVANVDITPGKEGASYSASGRVIDADSGQPVTTVYIAYSPVTDGDLQMSGMNFTGVQSDATGKFRLDSVKPGRYAVYTVATGQESTTYSDPAAFEIAEGDVTGLEIKVHRGATINGTAVIENNFDPAVAASLQSVVLFAYVAPKGVTAPSFSSGKINSDGSFRLTGLSPGKARINVQEFPTPPKGLTLVRTEVEGLVQPDGIEITSGAQLKNVRLVFAYGTGIVRGDIKLEGGALPEGINLRLILRSPPGDSRKFNQYLDIDSRNHFTAENVPPGTYELFLEAVGANHEESPVFTPVTRPVTVANGMEVQATLVVNLAKKAGEN
jgi:protocatechuate 3,4-dioxygenase beta subunit